jgi:hypothetical protein
VAGIFEWPSVVLGERPGPLSTCIAVSVQLSRLCGFRPWTFTSTWLVGAGSCRNLHLESSLNDLSAAGLRIWYFPAMFSFGGEAHLVLNPSAGKGRAGGLRASVSRFFEERGLRPVWHVTQRSGHASSIVRGLPEEVSVVAVGGDGTVHEVAAACAGTGRIMGVLPAGSGND